MAVYLYNYNPILWDFNVLIIFGHILCKLLQLLCLSHYKASKFPNKFYLLACSSKITIHQVKQYNAYIPHQSTFFGCTNGVTKIINLDDVTKGHTRILKEIYCWVRFLLIVGYALLHVGSRTYWDSTRRPQNIWIFIIWTNIYLDWVMSHIKYVKNAIGLIIQDTTFVRRFINHASQPLLWNVLVDAWFKS